MVTTLLLAAVPSAVADTPPEKATPTVGFLTARQLPSTIHAPPLRGALSGAGAMYNSIDGAGIRGVDGLASSNFVHLENATVCGAACRIAGTTFGDEGNFYFCMTTASGQPAWPWKWSSGVSAPGTPGCTATAQSTVVVNTNGFITHPSVALCSTCYNPTNLPTSTAPNGGVYGLWADLDNSCVTGTNGFYTAWGGTSPNRYWIWEWLGVPKYPCSTTAAGATFEIILFEADNEVQVYYGAAGTFTSTYAAGEENSGTTLATQTGLQFARASVAAAPPQNNGIVWFDGLAPIVSSSLTCGTPGSNGWCKSATNSVKFLDNNDVGSTGKIGMGIIARVYSVDGGLTNAYTNNTAISVTLADGAHSVLGQVQDGGLNIGSKTQTLNVDTTPPVIDPVSDVTAEATGPSGAAVSFAAPTATDATSGVASIGCAPASGSTFALGDTTVSCTATDVAGNSASTSFAVHVVDTTAPTIDAASDITAEATSAAGAAVSYSAPATHDVVDGNGVASCSPASGSTFALGTSNVACSATDAHGNSATPSGFQVHVLDTTSPIIESASDITAEATSAAGATVDFASPATHDLVDGDGVSTCAPASGSLFALGSTSVSCTATDTAGNAATPSSFSVNVVDTTAPVIDAVSDITAEATSALGADVSFTAPASHDIVDGDGVATCAPAGGSSFGFGATTVTCSATDAAGNAASDVTFTVNVVDTTAPVIDAHLNVHSDADDENGAIVTYAAPAWHDIVDGDGVATCEPASGSFFLNGATTVTCSATDAAGNTGTSTFSVIVGDATPPTIDSADDVVAEATSAAGAIVSFSAPMAHDDIEGDFASTCAPASGSVFALGATTVTCTASDSSENAAEPVSFSVTVIDTTAPIVDAAPDVTVEASGPNGANVTFGAPASHDLVDGDGIAVCAPASGSLFAIGTTSVLCTATDAAGNSASTSFDVTVVLHVSAAVATEQATYDAVTALTEGVHGTFHVQTGDGSGLAGVAVKVRWIRVLPIVGYVQGEEVTGVTDGSGDFAFAPSLLFTIPGEYTLIGTVTQPSIATTSSSHYSVGVVPPAKTASVMPGAWAKKLEHA